MTSDGAGDEPGGGAVTGAGARPVTAPRLRRCAVTGALGELTLVASDQALMGVYFPAHRVEPQRASTGDVVRLDDLADDDVLRVAAGQLAEYLAGARERFELPLAPAPRSALEARVWDLLQGIPFGCTTSYGAIARELGDPHLAQAVGGAVGRNPLGIIIPCHRVVGGDGSYTGFAGGERRKAWLLAHEAWVCGSSLVPPEPWVDQAAAGPRGGVR